MRSMWYWITPEGNISEEQLDRENKKPGLWWTRYKKYVSEDILFFERAKYLGYVLWATDSVTCTHISNPNIVNIREHISIPNQYLPLTISEWKNQNYQ